MEATQFVTDTEIRTFINQSWRKVFDVLLSTHADHFTVVSSTFALTSVAPTKVLTTIDSNFYKLRGVEKQNGDRWITLKRTEFRERNNPQLTGYVLVNRTLYVVPEQAAPGTYRVWYVTEPTELTTDGTLIDNLPNGAEELVVIDAAIKCLTKEESDTGPLERQYAAELKRVLEASYDADIGDPPRVANVRSDGLSWDDISVLP